MLNILQVILHTGHVSPVARCVTLTVGRSAASSQPPFGPTLTRAAPTPLPGISGSLYRYGSAHRILVLMLRCAESAHLFFSFRINVSSNMFFFHIVHTYCDIFAKGEEKKISSSALFYTCLQTSLAVTTGSCVPSSHPAKTTDIIVVFFSAEAASSCGTYFSDPSPPPQLYS